MQLGLSTAAFYGRWETEDAAAEIAKLPLDCAEVFLQSDSEITPEFAALVRRNLGDIACVSVHPMGNYENYMAGRPARQMKDAFDHFEKVLAAGEALGAKTFVYHGRHTPLLKALPWNLKWNMEAIEPMCALAEKHGMAIGWENVCWCQLTTPERVLEAKAALAHVRFTLDIKQAMRAAAIRSNMCMPWGIGFAMCMCAIGIRMERFACPARDRSILMR